MKTWEYINVSILGVYKKKEASSADLIESVEVSCDERFKDLIPTGYVGIELFGGQFIQILLNKFGANGWQLCNHDKFLNMDSVLYEYIFSREIP